MTKRISLLYPLILILAIVFNSASAQEAKTSKAEEEKAEEAKKESKEESHAKVFRESEFPSASQCAPCHQNIYEEWRYSNHAYASISPMFNKFEQRINDLASGTVGFFCMRCHSGVGTTMREPRERPAWQRAQVSREGVTCISCHRVNVNYHKVNGARRLVPGDIYSKPMYGPFESTGVAEAIKNKEYYKVATSPEEVGLPIHQSGIKFEQINRSEFCVSCHQVAVVPGIKLETVWDEYRASPAHKKGISCQDCHMSTVPGQNSGFAKAPTAVISGREINPGSRHANHAMVGPGYPIGHPGVFPHNPEAERWSVDTWLKFDYRAGWGTDEFEEKLASGAVKANFPPEWAIADDRVQAALVIASNMKKLEEKRDQRLVLMEKSSHMDGPIMKGTPQVGKDLKFKYVITNTNPGHNMPSGSLGAQPEIWLNIALADPDGKRIWETGYVDSNGDFADNHSLDVRAGKLPADHQLVNLQSKFLTTNVKGTDREMYLPVPFDPDQIPFIRPGGVPVSNLNHPPFIRMEKRSIPPLGKREASFSVDGKLLTKPGKYKLAARLRSRAEPIYFMRFCFSTVDMERAMNEWMADIHPYTVEFEVK